MHDTPGDAPIPPSGFPGPGRNAPVSAYALAVAITVGAIYSQYFLPAAIFVFGPVGDFVLNLAIVYGIPVAALAALVGPRPLSRYSSNGGKAALEALRWYALMGLLTVAVLFVLVIIYTAIAPGALSQLNKPNPVLVGAAHDVGFWIGFSFAIGFIEETIFRGWIFGYWLARGTSRWVTHAIWTSLLFAGVHLYYGSTYGSASTFAFAQLFLGGVGFAAAYRYSGGNVVMISLIHGANDSIAFLTLVSVPLATGLHWLLIGIGALIALVLYFQGRAATATTVAGPPAPFVPYYWRSPPLPPPGNPAYPPPPPAPPYAPPVPPPPSPTNPDSQPFP